MSDAFLDRGEDFLQARDVEGLVDQMNALVGEDLIDARALERVQHVLRQRRLVGFGRRGQCCGKLMCGHDQPPTMVVPIGTR